MEPPELQLLPGNILRVFEILFKKYLEKFAESAVMEFILNMLLRLTHLPEDNTEKIWAHRFLAKPKMIAGGGLGGAVSPPRGPGRCLGEGVGVKPPHSFVFFPYKTR